MISVFFLVTLTPLDNMARFVIVIDPARIASAIPGTFLSATAKVASGVQSLGAVSYTHLTLPTIATV